jgi:hypothetical protein
VGKWLVVLLTVLEVMLPGVLLLIAPRWKGTVGPWVGGLTRGATWIYAGLTLFMDVGVFSLLAETVHGPVRCGTPFAGLFMMLGFMTLFSIAMCVLFSICFVQRLADGPMPILVVLCRFVCGLAVGAVLYFMWMLPFPFECLEERTIALNMVLPSAFGTVLTVWLVERMVARS